MQGVGRVAASALDAATGESLGSISDMKITNDPTQQYVIQLPRLDVDGGTQAVNRTAAQSSIVALNDHQLLILSRDGNGRGAGGSPVFKSILLADLNGATNIDGVFEKAKPPRQEVRSATASPPSSGKKRSIFLASSISISPSLHSSG